MPSTLIVFSTGDGHTLKICQRIQQVLEGHRHQVTLVAVDDALRMDCSAFDKIVVGASIRYGRHRPSLYEFVAKNRERLGRVPGAFFSVSAVARKPGKDTPERNPYFRTFTRAHSMVAAGRRHFRGQDRLSEVSALGRLIIQFIMATSRGPTDRRVAVEFTDCGAVKAFAERVSRA